MDENNVFWGTRVSGSTGGVMKLPRSGGSPEQLAAETPTLLALDEQNVYWASAAGKVMQLSKQGGTPRQLIALSSVRGLTVDNSNVYVSEYGALGGQIFKVPLDKGEPEVLAVGTFIPYPVVVDSANVYWANFNGTVMTVPIGGGETTTLATVGGQCLALAIANDKLYVTNVGGPDKGALYEVDADGKADPIVLASSQGRPQYLALDEDKAYWTNPDGVYYVPLIGGARVTITTDSLASPRGIAVDESNVYWTEYFTSKVQRAPK